ncbi:hypothetical protein PFISCL1PPCAC_26134, partial [Pristionchus fissidentatus]
TRIDIGNETDCDKHHRCANRHSYTIFEEQLTCVGPCHRHIYHTTPDRIVHWRRRSLQDPCRFSVGRG